MTDSITAFIRADLKARLRQGDGLPRKLTLAALSDHYQVSFTPVRLAVRELLREGVLCKQENGRLAVSPTQPISNEPPPVRPAAAPAVEGALTRAIIQLSLRGGDEYLREEATADRLGIGRTVLRQVLIRLAGQGLLEHLPRRGWKVRRFDEAEMLAYLQVRESLELKALDLAKGRLVDADLRRMLRGNSPTQGGPPSTPRLDNQIHRYLIDQAGNRYIRDFFDRHGLFFTTLFDYAAPEANVVRAMARQHRGILRALLAKDWPKARQALAHHIRAQAAIVRRLLRAGSRTAQRS